MYKMNLEYGSLPQNKETLKDFWGTEANLKVPMTSPLFWFAPLGPPFSVSFIGSLFCLWPINIFLYSILDLLWLSLDFCHISLHYLFYWQIFNTSFSAITWWVTEKNPQVLQNCTELIRKIEFRQSAQNLYNFVIWALTESINGPRPGTWLGPPAQYEQRMPQQIFKMHKNKVERVAIL